MMQAGELLSFASADGVLLFELRPRTAPKAMLAMTNTSSSSVVFKVRTTQPMWYYVRPNQDMLEAGQTVDLVFTLTEPECERFLDLYKAGNVESVDKHRFLIQAKPIEASDRDLILSLPAESPNRNAEVGRVFQCPQKSPIYHSPLTHLAHLFIKPKNKHTVHSHLGDGQQGRPQDGSPQGRV
jgi:hypothetical protein